jgi:hypothetical protein
MHLMQTWKTASTIPVIDRRDLMAYGLLELGSKGQGPFHDSREEQRRSTVERRGGAS